MDFGGPSFVIAIIAVSTAGWLINNWIRAKHGYSLEDEWGGKTEPQVQRKDNELREANQKLLQTMEKMQDRMIVLERIVTDKGYTVAEEIEALRDAPPARNVADAADQNTDSGVPMNFGKKEQV